jgi:hypothetical protein
MIRRATARFATIAAIAMAALWLALATRGQRSALKHRRFDHLEYQYVSCLT